MSNGLRAKAAPVAQFADPGKRKTAKADWVPFRIGETLFHLVTPKTYDIAQIMMLLESPAGLNDPENMKTMLRFAARLVRYVVVEPAVGGELRGRDLLEYRLQDADDNLDLANLVPILMDLVKQLVARPTGSPRASTVQRRAATSARGSAARTRSTPAKTSTRSRRSST